MIEDATTISIKPIKVKKVDGNTCKGCYNNGKSTRVCIDHNELFGVDCAKDRLIFTDE